MAAEREAERDAYEVLEVSRFASWPELRAAYRTLARRFHPDGTSPHTRRMVEINAAYACLEQVRQAAGEATSAGVPVGPGRWDGGGSSVPPPPSPAGTGSLLDRVKTAARIDTPMVDFGQYAGWRIAEIAECDPRYLRWLSRHSSGLRFQAAIEQVLGSDPEIGRPGALVR